MIRILIINNIFYYESQDYYNECMQIREKIKSLLALKCVTITKLAELMTEKTGEKYTFQRISHKLRLNRLTLAEAYIIADILGYDLEFIERKFNK